MMRDPLQIISIIIRAIKINVVHLSTVKPPINKRFCYQNVDRPVFIDTTAAEMSG